MTKVGAELYRSFPVHDLPPGGRPFAIEVGAEERGALAERFGILAVTRLKASGWVRPEAGGRRVKLEGRLDAEVVQTCVVTLDPVSSEIATSFERLYSFEVAEEFEEPGGEVFLDLSADVPVEPRSGDALDIGAAVAEQLSLDLDPYPRRPGAVFPGCDPRWAEPSEEAEPEGPFARLAGWRGRPDGPA